MPDLMLFHGNGSPNLAVAVANKLGVPIGRAKVGTFSDGETAIEILENVRGRDVFILQSTCPPTNDNLMEVVVMVDALRRSSAGRITAVIPYFGYARQDRRVRSMRVPITARVVADMLATVGVDRVVTVDIHAEQIQGFFHIPFENVFATEILLKTLQSRAIQNPVVVSPDIGGVVRARAMAKAYGCDLAIIDKRRPTANVAKVMHVIGEIAGRHCILVDDIVDTAGTLCKAAEALVEHGASKVSAYIVHPVLSGPAIENIQNSVLDEVVVTNSIELRDNAKSCAKIHQVSIADMISETIRRINSEESVSSMFEGF